jgi:putative transposase
MSENPKYDPDIHHRHSTRLKGYDYSQAGAYFVTLCMQNHECLFGSISDGKMILNDAGKMVEKWYHELTNKFSDIQCNEYMVMPNHFHCIIIIVGADLCVRPDSLDKKSEHKGSPLQRIVQWFKTMTTNEYLRNIKQNGWEPFICKLWQRNYYEHIIRDEDSLHEISKYIINNPMNWETDKENPEFRA